MVDDTSGEVRTLTQTQRSLARTISGNNAIPMAEEPREDRLKLNDLTGVLWRKKLVVAAGALLGILGGLAASLVTQPVYRARASVQIEGFNSEQFLRDTALVAPSMPNASPDNLLQNAVKLLESETLAKRVANKLTPRADKQPVKADGTAHALVRTWPVIPATPPAPEEVEAVRQVQKALRVRTSLQSQVIELLYDAPEPALAARGAATAADEFVDLNREARWQLARDTTDWLSKQADDLRAALTLSKDQLQNYARSSGLVFAGRQSTLAQDQVRQIQDALAKAETDSAAKQARFEAAKNQPAGTISDPSSSSPVHQYQADLGRLRRELALLKTTYTDNNYRIERIQAQISELEKSVESAHGEMLARLENDYQAAKGLENLLRRLQAVQLKTVEDQLDKERQYDIKKTEIDATQRLYESMLQRVKEAGAASALRTSNVRIIDRPLIPTAPYSPNYPLNIAIGFAIGTLGGIGLVLVRNSSPKVRWPGEMVVSYAPELGAIPAARCAMAIDGTGGMMSFLRRRGELRLVNRGPETGMLSESFHAALTSILFRTNGNTLRARGGILAVSSVDVKEGKTTVLTNLGVAAAERNQRVLLIDGDIRRPQLHKLLALPNTWGLADLVRHNELADYTRVSALNDLVCSTAIPNLWVLPSGVVRPDTANTLYSSDLELLLRRFRLDFDLVLIDTPPLRLYTDARLLGKLADGVVMVVRADTKSRDELSGALDKLAQDGIAVVGTILNDWKMDSSERRIYSRYYDHYRRRPE